MSVTSKEIKTLIDASTSGEEKELQFTYWMLFEPGRFWPAISKRMLGDRRLQRLGEISLLMARSSDKKTNMCGIYLWAVLRAIQQSESDEWKAYHKKSAEASKCLTDAFEFTKKRMFKEAKEAFERYDVLTKELEYIARKLLGD